MSFEYQIKMTCDRCGTEIETWTPAKSYEKIKVLRWDWKRKHKESGVMLGLPNRYGKYTIYCQECADGAAPAKRNERFKRIF